MINLDRAHERRKHMESQLALAGLPCHRIPAVDGQALGDNPEGFDPRSYAFLHRRRMVPAEVGCYFSHIETVRRFLASDADFALILEDDISFGPNLIAMLDAAMCPQAAKHWNILRLSTVNAGKKYPIHDLGNGASLALSLTREKGAGAYVIDRKAGEWILRDLLPMRLAYDIAFDLEHLYGLRAVFVHPQPANQRTGLETQIQKGIHRYKLSRWYYLTVLPYRTWLEISRFAVRGKRLVVARLSGLLGGKKT